MSELRSCPQEYKLLFEGAGSNPGDKTLEDRFFEHEVTHTIRQTYSQVLGCLTASDCTSAQSQLRRVFSVHWKHFTNDILHVL